MIFQTLLVFSENSKLLIGAETTLVTTFVVYLIGLLAKSRNNRLSLSAHNAYIQ